MTLAAHWPLPTLTCGVWPRTREWRGCWPSAAMRSWTASTRRHGRGTDTPRCLLCTHQPTRWDIERVGTHMLQYSSACMHMGTMWVKVCLCHCLCSIFEFLRRHTQQDETTTLLQYTIIYSPNVFGYLAFIRVGSEVISAFFMQLINIRETC